MQVKSESARNVKLMLIAAELKVHLRFNYDLITISDKLGGNILSYKPII